MMNKFLADGRLVFISTLLLALSTISAAVVLPTVLEAATRKQCLNHDWPAEKHAVHLEFCQSYGYSTTQHYGPAF